MILKLVTVNGPLPTGWSLGKLVSCFSDTCSQTCLGMIGTISRSMVGVGLVTRICTVYLPIALTLLCTMLAT